MTTLRGIPFAGNGIYLFWDPPDEPNGIVIGYQIDYKTIERYVASLAIWSMHIVTVSSIVAQPGLDQPSIIIRDPMQREYLLGGLRPNTKYRVQVRARTMVGLSTSPAMIELTTNMSLGTSILCIE